MLAVGGLLAVSGCAQTSTSAARGSTAASVAVTVPSSAAVPASPAPGSVVFQGVAVGKATDLKQKPVVTSTATTAPAALQVKDLVVGTGAAATPTSTVTVQYVGVRYADGVQFDASWDRGAPAQFPLTGVVPGFTQGIGGSSAVGAMKVGGRRVMILPAALGYGSSGTPDGSIPPDAAIVFVVDLVKIG